MPQANTPIVNVHNKVSSKDPRNRAGHGTLEFYQTICTQPWPDVIRYLVHIGLQVPREILRVENSIIVEPSLDNSSTLQCMGYRCVPVAIPHTHCIVFGIV